MLLHLVSTLLYFIVGSAHAGTYYIESTDGTCIRIHNDGRVDLTKNKGSLEKIKITYVGKHELGDKEYLLQSVANGRYLSVPKRSTLTTDTRTDRVLNPWDYGIDRAVRFQLRIDNQFEPDFRVSIMHSSLYQEYLNAEGKLDLTDEATMSTTFNLVSTTDMKSFNPIVYNIRSAHGTKITLQKKAGVTSAHCVSDNGAYSNFTTLNKFMIKYLHNSFYGKVYAIKWAHGEKYLSARGSGKWVNVITQDFAGSWEKFFIKTDNNGGVWFKSRKWKNYLRAPKGDGVPLNTATSRNSWERFDLIEQSLQL